MHCRRGGMSRMGISTVRAYRTRPHYETLRYQPRPPALTKPSLGFRPKMPATLSGRLPVNKASSCKRRHTHCLTGPGTRPVPPAAREIVTCSLVGGGLSCPLCLFAPSLLSRRCDSYSALPAASRRGAALMPGCCRAPLPGPNPANFCRRKANSPCGVPVSRTPHSRGQGGNCGADEAPVTVPSRCVRGIGLRYVREPSSWG
jgi:hypothetical protein